MDVIIRAAGIYVILFVLLRLSGKRTMSQISTFDFVLLLIISEAIQQAMLGDDYSLMGAGLAVLTLLTLDRVSDTLSWRSSRADRLLNDGAVIVVENGRLHDDRMRMYRLDADDVLQQARRSQGIERIDQIKYAVLERTGAISVVPVRD